MNEPLIKKIYDVYQDFKECDRDLDRSFYEMYVGLLIEDDKPNEENYWKYWESLKKNEGMVTK